MPQDVLCATLTAGLSALLVTGYCLIAINWYFQAKLSARAEAKAALARLRNLCLCCGACGYTLYATEVPTWVWGLYDLVLLGLVVRTGAFLRRTRGIGLVDERLAQVEDLERSARRYREIAELLPHMVWTATPDGRIDFANQSWRQYAGAGRSWLDVLHPDDRAMALQRWREALERREPLTLEVRLAGAVQRYRSFIVKATPITHGPATPADGPGSAAAAAVRWLGACSDIEDQKRFAAAQERQARQKSFFLNALSHDLRAPLHNVLLNAHLLRMSVHDEADVESVRMITENAMAAGDLVTRLLDFAKVGAQDRNVIELVDVGRTLHQIVHRFAPVTAQKGLYLCLSGDDAGVRVKTDRQKLERIISNLLDNAIKYTAGGGISVELSVLTRGAGSGGEGTSGGECSVRITDTGIGIPPANVPYLFDEFYQVDNYERDRGKGFGMGLAICRCLARHLGGDVRLVSTGPRGSCFELVFPMCAGPGRPDPGGERDIEREVGHDRERGAQFGAELGTRARAEPVPADVGADRGGRPGGKEGDHADPQPAGLCRL